MPGATRPARGRPSAIGPPPAGPRRSASFLNRREPIAMTPFKVPDGPYTVDQIMEAIREQVVEADAPAACVPPPPAPPAPDRAPAPPSALDLERLRESLALLTRRQ